MRLNMITPFTQSAALLFAATAVAAIAANDWPQWGGPRRNGCSPETGLLKQWPQQGPPLVWKTTGLGAGYSGVTLAGERVYTAGDKADANYVLALNRADGTLVWSAKLGKAGAPGWGGFAGPRASVTIDGERLYAVGQYGELVCVQAADGKELWRQSYTEDFGSKVPEWGFSESVLVDGDRVVCTPGSPRGTLVALNKQTGELLWQSQEFTDEAHYASVNVTELGGVRQYVQLTEKSLAGVAARDGKLLWKTARKGATAVIPDPIISGDYIYVTSGYGIGCNLFKVAKEGDGFGVQEVYKNKVIENHHGGAVLVGEHLYGFSEGKGWTCQELKTGKVVWQAKESAKDQENKAGKVLGKGSILYADGHLYLRSEAGPGTLALIDATPAGYKETGRFDPPNRSDKNSWPHPVVADGRLYVRDQDVLLCYEVKQK